MSAPTDHVRVTLEWPTGDRECLTVRPDETVIEATERVGSGVAFGCLTGACGTCTGRLLASDAGTEVREVFSYRRAPRALKAHHEGDGYVLLCVAEPVADCRLAVGASVQAELVENPWK